MRWIELPSVIAQELRQATRTLRRQPTYALVVILTLALGIGANTAIFSVFQAVQLRSLPFAEEESLVQLWETVQRQELEERPFSWPDFQDVRERTRTLEAVAAYDEGGVFLSGDEASGEVGSRELLRGEWVTPGYLDLLGIRPLLGDPFSRLEQGALGRSVILGHGLWQNRFGGDPEILGTILRMSGEPYDVVGVAPPDFVGLSDEAEFFLAMVETEPGDLGRRGSRYLSAVGRLAPGVGIAAVNAELEALFTELEAAHPDPNQGYRAKAVPLRDELIGELSTPLKVLLAAVGLVLLIACANLANLCLVRAADRRRELAVRRALGAGLGRLVLHFQAEILILALLGGALGVLLSLWGLEALPALAPVEIPTFADLRLDLPVLAFTLALCLLTAFGLGAVTAWGARDSDPAQDLERGHRGSTGSRSHKRFRSLLVVAEVALALTLLVGAGLTLRSLLWLTERDLGFEPKNLVSFVYQIPRDAADGGDASDDPTAAEEEDRRAKVFATQVQERLRALPGVESASVSSDLPFGNRSAVVVAAEGQVAEPGAPYGGGTRTYFHRVSPGFFETLGAQLLSGSDFTPADMERGSVSVMVSRTLGEKLWPGENPIGKRVYPGSPPAAGAEEDDDLYRVIAVVDDLRYRTLVDIPGEPADPDLYVPMGAPRYRAGTVALRTPLPIEEAVDRARRSLQELDPRVVVFRPNTMENSLAEATARSRFSALLLALFAATALLLASIGIYGVMAYSVGRRRREMGIRLALGARARRLVASLVGQGLALAAAGVVAGLLAATAATRLLAGELFGVEPLDPATFGLTAALLLAVAILAAYLPARRASRIEPSEVLRDE